MGDSCTTDGFSSSTTSPRCASCSRKFEREGHLVETAANGRQALNAVARASFNLIFLTDLGMPLLGRRELAQALRQHFVRTPVIAISAHPKGLERGSSLPVTAVIGKPFPLATLFALVNDVVQGTKKPHPTQQPIDRRRSSGLTASERRRMYLYCITVQPFSRIQAFG